MIYSIEFRPERQKQNELVNADHVMIAATGLILFANKVDEDKPLSENENGELVAMVNREDVLYIRQGLKGEGEVEVVFEEEEE